MYNLGRTKTYRKGVFGLGVNTKNVVLPTLGAKDVLEGVKTKIENNSLLREVYYKKDEDFKDLIAKHSGEKVMLAVQLIESYKLLLEMGESYFD